MNAFEDIKYYEITSKEYLAILPSLPRTLEELRSSYIKDIKELLPKEFKFTHCGFEIVKRQEKDTLQIAMDRKFALISVLSPRLPTKKESKQRESFI